MSSAAPGRANARRLFLQCLDTDHDDDGGDDSNQSIQGSHPQRPGAAQRRRHKLTLDLLPGVLENQDLALTAALAKSRADGTLLRATFCFGHPFEIHCGEAVLSPGREEEETDPTLLGVTLHGHSRELLRLLAKSLQKLQN